MGAYAALGNPLLIFDEHLTTKNYSLGGSLQVPYYDCQKVRRYLGEQIMLYLHHVPMFCPNASPISHSQTTGPI